MRIEAKKEFKGQFAKESKPTVNLSSHQSKKPVRPTDDQDMKGMLSQVKAFANNLEIFFWHLMFIVEETRNIPTLKSYFVEAIIRESL